MRRDDGSIAPAVPAIALILLLLGGLVLDASRLLNLRGRALAYAEEAARAGAGALQPRPDGFLRVDPLAARSRVEEYCDIARDGGSVRECQFLGVEAPGGTDTRPLAVRVRVQMSERATLLGIVGLSDLTATGEARARPVEGTDDQDRDSPPEGVALPQPVEVDPIPVQGPSQLRRRYVIRESLPCPAPRPQASARTTATLTTASRAVPRARAGEPRPIGSAQPVRPAVRTRQRQRPAWQCSVFAYPERPGGQNDT